MTDPECIADDASSRSATMKCASLVLFFLGTAFLVSCLHTASPHDVTPPVDARLIIDARLQELLALSESLKNHDDAVFIEAVTQYVLDTTPPSIKDRYIDVYRATLEAHAAYVDKHTVVHGYGGFLATQLIAAERRDAMRRVLMDQVARMATQTRRYAKTFQTAYPYEASMIEDYVEVAAQLRRQ